MCGFSVHLSVNAAVFPNMYITVQKGQAVVFDTLPCEFDVIVHRVKVFSKCLHLCAVSISVPVAWNCSVVRIQSLVYYVF